MTSRKISELDHASIKAELIAYIKSNPTFTDYDFEGSALNTLIDLLAYNTHYTSFYANMIHNESFLDTAQRRSSALSRAKELGYTPRSAISSTAYVDIQLFGVTNTTTQPPLARGTIIKGRNENGVFDFIVNSDVGLSVENSGNFYRNVELKEGTIVTNTFRVDSTNIDKQVFTIPNANIDTTSLRVFVRESYGSVNVDEYVIAKDVFNIDENSKVFFLQESYEELFQIYFGDNVIGSKLSDGNEITVSYILGSNTDVANGCAVFNIESVGNAASAGVIVLNPSFSGKQKESLSEIKNSIVKSYASQNRAVTNDDYTHIVKREFPFIKNIKTWGGEDNIPPVYGKVFISIQPEEGFVISDVTKTGIIIPEIKKYSVLTITPEIVDPEYTFIKCDVTAKFNKNKTSSTESDVKDKLIQAIRDYFNNNVATFAKDVLKGSLINTLIDTDPGLITLDVEFTNSFKISPVVGVSGDYSISQNNKIVKGSVRSTVFKYFVDGVLTDVHIVDNPTKLTKKVDNSGFEREYGKLELIGNKDERLITEIGTVEYSAITSEKSGTFDFSIKVDELIDPLSGISVYYTVNDSDVFSARNQILTLDERTENLNTSQLKGLTINLVAYEK